MKVRFWGVRGSIPTPGPSTVKYGGNTSCIEIRGDKNELIILDSGTGIRDLGNFLIANDLRNGPLDLNILLSHTHWDHIQGFPFFGPAYIPTSKIKFHGPVNFSGKLGEIVAGQMNYSYFPIKLDELKATIKFNELQETTFELGPFKITTKYLNHPILDLGYRIEYNNKVFVSVYDNEPYTNLFASGSEDINDLDSDAMEEAELYVEEMNNKIIELIKDADLVVYDAQYRKEEYESKKGWGHSTIEHAIDAGVKGNAKRLALFHHDPLRTDAQMDDIQRYAKNQLVLNYPEAATNLMVFAARERLEVSF